MTRAIAELPMLKAPHISILEPAGSRSFSTLGSRKESVSTTTLMASSSQQFFREYDIPLLCIISQFGISFVACWRPSSRDAAMRACAATIWSADSMALLAASFASFSCFVVNNTPTIVATTAITALIALIHVGASMASPLVGYGDTPTVGDERGEGGGLSGSSSPSSRGGGDTVA